MKKGAPSLATSTIKIEPEKSIKVEKESADQKPEAPAKVEQAKEVAKIINEQKALPQDIAPSLELVKIMEQKTLALQALEQASV